VAWPGRRTQTLISYTKIAASERYQSTTATPGQSAWLNIQKTNSTFRAKESSRDETARAPPWRPNTMIRPASCCAKRNSRPLSRSAPRGRKLAVSQNRGSIQQRLSVTARPRVRVRSMPTSGQRQHRQRRGGTWSAALEDPSQGLRDQCGLAGAQQKHLSRVTGSVARYSLIVNASAAASPEQNSIARQVSASPSAGQAKHGSESPRAWQPPLHAWLG